MKMRVSSNRGSATLGIISVSFLFIASLAGWLATWQHYHNNTTAPACSASSLHLSIGVTDGTAGTQYTHAVLTNQGSNACVLSGYPTAFLTDSNNSSLGGIAPSGAPQSLTLNPGKSAHVVVAFPDHENFGDPSVCSAASTNFELYPPGSTASLSTALVQYVCSGTTVGSFSTGQ